MTESTTAETKQKADGAPQPDDAQKIDSPTKVRPVGWKFTAKNAWRQFSKDQCTDLAAALTYYAVLALFPALLALTGMLALFGQSSGGTQALLDIAKQVLPSDAYQQMADPITQMVNSRGTGLALVIGIVSALWSASGYVGAFGRAMNRIYEVAEGRPVWKLRPTNLLVTVFTTVVMTLMLVGSVLSGSVLDAVLGRMGLSGTATTVFAWLKIPVMLVLVMLMVAVLYHFTPNVRQPKFKWVSVGATVAIGVWVVASLLFGLYVTYAGNYSKTYGALAGAIIMLLWLWISNLALLFGAEVDSELERARQLQSGIRAEESLQLPPKDDSGIQKAEKKEAEAVEEAREVRMASSGQRPLDATDEKAAARAREKAGLDEDGFVAG